MADLVVVAFDRPDAADRVLHQLTALSKEQLIQLEDACVVVRPRVNRWVARASASVRPGRAATTCDGSATPAVHADPDEVSSPAMSKENSSASAVRPGTVRWTLPGSRRVPGGSGCPVAGSRSRGPVRRTPSRASTAAAGPPTSIRSGWRSMSR